METVPFSGAREIFVDQEECLGARRYMLPLDDEEFSLLHWAGSGPTVLLIHANGFSAGTYAPLAQKLVTAGYDVLAIDLRGHGRTGAKFVINSHNWQTFGNDLSRLLAVAQRPLHLMGHSLGGLSAIYAAGNSLQNIASLTLLDPTMFGPQYHFLYNCLKWSGLWARIPIVRNTLKRKPVFPSVVAAFTHYRPKSVFASWSDAFLYDYVASATVPQADGRVALCCAPQVEGHLFMTTPHYIFGTLRKIVPPARTLLLYGEYSYVVSQQSVRAFRKCWPGARVLQINGGCHFFPMSHTDYVVWQWVQWQKELAEGAVAA